MNSDDQISQMLMEDTKRLAEYIHLDTKKMSRSPKNSQILIKLRLIEWRRNLVVNAAAIVALVVSCLVFWFTQSGEDHRYVLLLIFGLSSAYAAFLWHHDPDY